MIAIIGILAAILLVSVGNVRQSAQQTKAMNNMRQLHTAVMLYTQDHNGMIPLGDAGADGAGLGGRGLIWINAIAKYLELDHHELDENGFGDTPTSTGRG